MITDGDLEGCVLLDLDLDLDLDLGLGDGKVDELGHDTA